MTKRKPFRCRKGTVEQQAAQRPNGKLPGGCLTHLRGRKSGGGEIWVGSSTDTQCCKIFCIFIVKQECIPVGCVPSAAVTV